MYVADQPIKRHRVLKSLKIASVMLLIVALVAGWLIWKDATKASIVDTSKNTAITSKVAEEKVVTKLYDEPYFSIELPEDWTIISRNDKSNSPLYIEWQQGKGSKDRWLKLYYDNIPTDTPINRLLPITVTNGRIVPSVLSENCSTFTGLDQKDKSPGQKVELMASKWQNINFICDLGRSERNVTGTGADGFGYAVPLTGETKGKHTYFFMYTDHNVRPDYKIFTDALRTFTAK